MKRDFIINQSNKLLKLQDQSIKLPIIGYCQTYLVIGITNAKVLQEVSQEVNEK